MKVNVIFIKNWKHLKKSNLKDLIFPNRKGNKRSIWKFLNFIFTLFIKELEWYVTAEWMNWLNFHFQVCSPLNHFDNLLYTHYMRENEETKFYSVAKLLTIVLSLFKNKGERNEKQIQIMRKMTSLKI